MEPKGGYLHIGPPAPAFALSSSADGCSGPTTLFQSSCRSVCFHSDFLASRERLNDPAVSATKPSSSSAVVPHAPSGSNRVTDPPCRPRLPDRCAMIGFYVLLVGSVPRLLPNEDSSRSSCRVFGHTFARERIASAVSVPPPAENVLSNSRSVIRREIAFRFHQPFPRGLETRDICSSSGERT